MGGREDQGRANPSAAFGKQMSRADQGPGRRRPMSGGSFPRKSPGLRAEMYSLGCSGQPKSSADLIQSQSDPRGMGTVRFLLHEDLEDSSS